MKQRVALLGAGGQLGTALTEIWPSNWEFIPATRRDLDLADFLRLEEWLSVCNPVVVLNAAAYNGVESAEFHPREAWEINATAVGVIGDWCRRSNAYFLNVSTDYVFSGHASAEILEDSETGPLCQYGRSKEGGEKAFWTSGTSGAIVRTSAVFGTRAASSAPHNFLDKILLAASANLPFPVRDDLTFCPTWGPDLARVVVAAVNERLEGVIHATSSGHTSWYGWAFHCLELGGKNPERILQRSSGDGDGLAKRPRFTVLGNSRDDIKTLWSPLPWQEATKLYLQKKSRCLK